MTEWMMVQFSQELAESAGAADTKCPPETTNAHDRSEVKSKNKNKNPNKRSERNFIDIDVERLQFRLIEEEDKNRALKDEVAILKRSNRSLEDKLSELQERSNKFTEELARRVDNSEEFENNSSIFSNHKISKEIRKLYDQDWAFLCRNLGKEMPEIEELERIKLMSQLMKTCYEECIAHSEKMIRQFLFLDESEALPAHKELQEIYRQWRKFYQKKSAKIVSETVLEKINQTEEAKYLEGRENIGKVKEQLKSFYLSFTGCCWLVVISHPPIVLNFDVVGKPFEELKQGWTEYSTKKVVEETDVEAGTVKLVVWPSVELKDGSHQYQKGDVLVVKKRKEQVDKANESYADESTVCLTVD